MSRPQGPTAHDGQASRANIERTGVSRRELLVGGVSGAGALAVGGLVSACGGASKGKTTLVGTTGRSIGGGRSIPVLTFGVVADAGSFDYTQSYDISSLLVVPSVTEPLLRFDSSGRLHPNLATAYDVSNPRRVVFKIRPGVRFHDGTALTAEDVAYSMGRHLDPKVASLLAFYYVHVDHVEATGPLEVTAFMKQPDIEFVYAMSTNAGAIASKAFIEKHGKTFGTPAVGTMGTGPYRFGSWTKGQSYTVLRNEHYWNPNVDARVNTFTAHVIADEATLIAALRAGELNGQLDQISGRGVQSLASAPRLKQYRTPCGGGDHMDFNVQRKPWDDARVRQALSLVIPRQGLIDSAWGGQATLVKSMTPPTTWSYARPVFARAYAGLPDYTRTGPSGGNLKRAQELISQAGAHGATGALWVDTAYDDQQAQAIQAAASQIGLRLSVNHVTLAAASAAYTDTKGKPYDMYASFSIPDVPDPANLMALFYSSKSNQNYMAFADPRIDTILAKQAALVSDPTKRAQLLCQAQEIIVRDQVDPVLVSPYIVLSLDSRYGGYQVASPQFQWDCQMIASISAA